MKISAKTRYGLASAIFMSDYYQNDEYVSLLLISDRLNISKIYLEQVFSSMKKSKLVRSQKGPKGGYILQRPAEEISLYDVFLSLEPSLFERTDETLDDADPHMEKVMTEYVFARFDEHIAEFLKSVSGGSVARRLRESRGKDAYMYYL
jgi:Rrf2 family protein